MTVPSHLAGDDSLSERITDTTRRLAVEFGGKFSTEDIENAARKYLASYEHASVLDFVPLFVERYTREMLRAGLAQQPA